MCSRMCCWFRELVIETIDGLSTVAFSEVRNTKEKIHLWIIRIAGQHLLEQLDRIVEFEFCLIKDCQAL